MKLPIEILNEIGLTFFLFNNNTHDTELIGAARSFYLVAPSSTSTVDQPSTIVVWALDQFSNIAQSFSGAVRVHLNGSGIPSTSDVLIVNGVGSFTVQPTLWQNISFILEDAFSTGLTSTSSLVVHILPGPFCV